MSDISFKPVVNTRFLFAHSFDIGLVFKHYNLTYIGFQAEAYIVNRGYRQPIDLAELGDTLYKRVNTYLEIPMFMQVRYNLKIFTIHANVGPYIAYLLKAREGDNSTEKFVMQNINLNILRDNRIDYGLLGGIGISTNFKWGSIYAEGRIGYGFGDLFKHTYSGMPKESKAIFQGVNMGYLYRFKSK